MLATAVDLLTTPREFFADRPAPALRWPALVVATSGLFQATVVAAIVLPLGGILPAEVPLVAIVAGLFPLLAAVGLVAWLLATGALYALSYPLAGRGHGRRLLAYVGWGWLPQTLGTLVLAVAAVLAVTQLQPPTDEAAAREFARQLQEGRLLAFATVAGTAQVAATGSFDQVQTVVSVGATLWSGYVWVGALVCARGLARGRALLAVAPLVLFMIVG